MNVNSKIHLQKSAQVGTTIRPVVKYRLSRADRASLYRRVQSVVVKNQSASSLAQYPFTQKRKSPITTEWFQRSINEIVKHLSESPLLHVARFRSMSSMSSIDDDTTPFTSYSSSRHQTLEVDSSVLPTPELWESIAEHLTGADPDAVILVQRVHDVQHHLPSSPSSTTSTTTTSNNTNTTNDQAVESVCRKLVASGVAESILTGKVGDCCDGKNPNSSSSKKKTSILPSTTSSSNSNNNKARVAVRTAAIPITQPTGQETAYWGVVVQSKLHTGSEGCYLLKTVRNVCSTGCTCTHFSLTRVCHRENLEKQFVDSWLV